MASFKVLLERRLAEAKLSQNQLAIQSGISRAFVTDIVMGRRKPTLVRVEKFAEVLGLTGKAREEFIDAGALLHAPDRVRVLVGNAYPNLKDDSLG